MLRATISFDADYAVWDGSNCEELKAVAGDQWLGATGKVALVQGASGRLEHLEPGWVVYRQLGAARAVVTSPGATPGIG